MLLHYLEILGILITAGRKDTEILLRLLYLLLKLRYGFGCIPHLFCKVRDITGIDNYVYFRNFLR